MGFRPPKIAPALEGATILFDLDGTIADTAPDLIDATNAALVSEGFEPAIPEAIKPAAGYGAKAMLRAALTSQAREADAAGIQRLADKLFAHYEENIDRKTVLFPGFIEAAELLRSEGARLALCTNKREHLALRLIAALGIEPLFEAIAGRETFPFHKPDPRHITELVRLAGGKLSGALMIGDSEADMEAAAAAGIPSVAVRFGYATVAAEKLGATAIIGHFGELPLLARTLLLTEKSV
jgi:phosphoglycolate phosphatase